MMNVVFTQHAVDRMRERGFDPSEVNHLLGVIDRVSETPDKLTNSPEVALLRLKGQEAMYLVRAGSLRAVLIDDIGKKPDGGRDGIVVANVYGRGEEEIGGTLSGSVEAPIATRAG
jgi:hypothetical protein